jgi:MFS family permease
MQANEVKDPIHVDEKAPEKSAYKDADKALEFLRVNEDGEEGTVVSIDEKTLVKKIDWMIVPIMFACYFLQYLDKSLRKLNRTLAYDNLLTYHSELCGSHGHQRRCQPDNGAVRHTVLAFLPCLPHFRDATRIPHATAANRKVPRLLCLCLGHRRYVAFRIGSCSSPSTDHSKVACTAACDSYASLAVCRFLLGAFESAISPSLILVTSMWYKRDEQPRRIGFWYLGVGMAVMVGSLVSYGFQHYEGDKFNNWQIMYLVVGLITIGAGIIVILFLPDNPMSSRLTHDEKIMAVSRLRENNTGIENKTFKPYQFREAMTDPQVWLLAFITTAASIPNGAVSSFQSVIISGFGFSNKETALIQIPGGLITAVSTLIGTYIAGRYNCRGLMLVTWAALGGIVGGGMIAFIPASNRAGRLAGNYLTNMTGSFLPLAYALAACNFAVSFISSEVVTFVLFH